MMNSGHNSRARATAHGLDVRQLRAYVAVVDHGSMVGAAQALGLAQSTVSEALASLERVLGTVVAVRQRGSGGMTITPAGEALLPHARQVLADLDAAAAAVAEIANEAHATVELIANDSISTYLLPNVLTSLRVRWPRTQFAVSIGTCEAVRAAVRDGSHDVGILLESVGSHDTAHVRRTVLNPDVPLVVFARTTHPLLNAEQARPVPREALAGYPLFVSDAAGDFYSLFRAFFDADGLPGPIFDPVGTVEGVKRGVIGNGRALGIVPAYALLTELAARSVAVVPVSPAPPRVSLDVLMSAGRRCHPAVTALLDALAREVAASAPKLVGETLEKVADSDLSR